MTVIKASKPDPTEPTEPGGDDGGTPSLERILALDLMMTVMLAEKEVYLRDVLELRMGDVLEFEKGVDDPLHVAVNNKPIGSGMAVKWGEKFGLRVQKILSPEETVRLLGTST